MYLQGRYGETIEKMVTFKSNEEDADFRITKIESNIDDKITYKLVDGVSPGEYSVKVWKNPKLAAANTYGSLYVHTNSEKSPMKTVQVQVITKGDITVQPSTVNFGSVKNAAKRAKDDPLTKSVMLIKTKGEFDIKNISFSSENYTARIEPMTPGRRYKVLVSFIPSDKSDRPKPAKNYVDEMIIETDDPREKQIRVRLIARSI